MRKQRDESREAGQCEGERGGYAFRIAQGLSTCQLSDIPTVQQAPRS